MKKNKKFRHALKIAFVLLALAGWVSIPLLTNHAQAGDSIPILTRNASLISPTGSVDPHGHATYELYAGGGRELEIEIEDVNLPAGTVLTAFVDGNSVGQLTLQIDQRGRLKLRTELGQTVPVTNDGSTVQVRNGSTVLVAGVFSGGGPNPSPTASPTGSPNGTPNPSPTGSPNGTPNPSPTGSPNGTPNPSPSPTGSPNSGNLFAGLSGPTLNGVLPGGYAEFEIHSSRVELEIRLRQVNLPAGTALTVLVNDIQAGTLFIEGGGEGRLRLRSDDGATIPAIIAGSRIVIKNGAAVILSGTFAGFTGPSPSPSPSGSPNPSPSPSLGRSFEAHLTGSHVQPPVQTAATGEFKVTLNAAETEAVIFGEFHNLGSNQTGARIETTTGTPVIVRNFGVVGGNNGNFVSVTVPVSAALVQQLRTGLWSAVITSTNNPNGEIRGQFIQRSNASDFDGDGSNDLAVYRPSEGIWYSLNGSGYSTQNLGNAQAKVVSGDYDGDGRTDAAVFKSDNSRLATWEIKRSSDGGITLEQFGYPTDIPARGDFDGDGRSDLAVYRPSTGYWYIRNSSNPGYAETRFGLTGDVPIPSDMDGDGRDDIVVYRPSSGTWYWLRSSDGQYREQQFGLNGDVPVRGDFDGDGKQDFTLFRPSNSTWYTLRSSDFGYSETRFGLSGDIPVAGKYDSDGKTDIGVFRPSDGHWYILRSSDGSYSPAQFGLSGDIPVISR